MDQSKIYTLLEQVRGSITSEQYVEIIAVGSLIAYISKDEKYNEEINIQQLLRAETNADDVLEQMLTKIEEEIPQLSDVFTYLTAINQLESTQITRFFYTFNELLQELSAEEIIEMYLSIDTSKDNYMTPPSINNLATLILQPTGSLYDGTIHYAGGAITMYKDANSRNKSLRIVGQEIATVTWAIAKIRLFITGVEEAEIALGDTLTDPAYTKGHAIEKFDYVYMAPPFGMRIKDRDILKADQYNRFFYGFPPISKGDYAFVSHALASLKGTGKGICVLPDGALFRAGAEGKIRQNIIQSDLIESVIALPGGFYNYTSIPVNLVVFNKSKEASRRNRIQFIKVTDKDVEKKRHTKKLTSVMINKIAHVFHEGIEETEFSRILTNNQLEEGNLLPSRYILPTTLNIEGVGEVKFNLEKLQLIDKVKLNNHATFYRGFNVGAKNEESPNGKYKIIRLSDVQNGKVLLNQVPHYEIDNNARIEMYRVQKGDVIISIRGTSIKAAVIEDEINNLLISQNFIGIRCASTINPYYLKAFIESPVGQYLLTNKMSGTAILTLGRKDLETLEVPYMPEGKQEEIMMKYINREHEIETEISKLERELKDQKMELYKNMKLKEIFTM